MSRYPSRKERGQGIVIVALMLVALLAISALAIDGGLTFAQRRTAQNAADAGALAGARVMCSPTGGDPVVAARDYANRNGIDDAATNVQVSSSQVGFVSSVVVSVTLPYDTFLAGVIDLPSAEVGAVAEAACYPPCSSNGVLPIAWSCKQPDVSGTNVGTPCDVFPHDNDGCQYGDDPIYIVANSAKIEEDIDCEDSGINCDIDGDGVNDITALSGGNRAWLDLDGKASEGANELRNWVKGENVPELFTHSWYAGETGAIDKVYKDIDTYRLNQDVLIPVFDDFAPGLKNGERPSPGQWHDGIDKFIDDGAGDYFHIITFAGFHITCVSYGPSVHCPAKDFLIDNNPGIYLKNNDFTVEGCFTRGLFDGGGLPGQCNYDTGVYTLKLIR